MRLPQPPPADLQSVLSSKAAMARVVRAVHDGVVQAAPGGRYRHWDKLRHLQPPAGLSAREWWLALKMARRPGLRPLPIQDKQGRRFVYGLPEPALARLREVELLGSGQRPIDEAVNDPGLRERYMVSSLIEEAISSSQLEGASTTLRVARDMLRSGRRPLDKSERMIVNNFRTMNYVRERLDRQLTPDLVRAIHAQVVEGTLDDPSAAGRFRRPDEDVRVVSDEDGTVLHEPPPARSLARRLRALCDFANEGTTEAGVHPIVRAILLHFWLAYDHPFVDGNGRTARALFYWSMLRSGYRFAEFASISHILNRAPSDYSRAFLYTETDDNDLTYFLLHQLRAIQLAFDHLREYLERKQGELHATERLLRRSVDWNHRQLALLSHALRHRGARYTIQSHQRSHRVVYQTARADLTALVKGKLLRLRQSGRQHVFEATPELRRRMGRR